jgi:hypothetical protein
VRRRCRRVIFFRLLCKKSSSPCRFPKSCLRVTEEWVPFLDFFPLQSREPIPTPFRNSCEVQNVLSLFRNARRRVGWTLLFTSSGASQGSHWTMRLRWFAAVFLSPFVCRRPHQCCCHFLGSCAFGIDALRACSPPPRAVSGARITHFAYLAFFSLPCSLLCSACIRPTREFPTLHSSHP